MGHILSLIENMDFVLKSNVHTTLHVITQHIEVLTVQDLITIYTSKQPSLHV
jgi:hypothetical protein